MPNMPSLPTSLFPAVFRTIPFEATEINRELGRLNVVHELPERDEPYTQDMRRKTRRWSFRGFVTGESAPILRDLLMAACETKGPGPLWHPNIGLAMVRCENCKPGESVENGQLTTYFDLEFVEAGSVVSAGLLITVLATAKTAVMGAAAGIVYAASAPNDATTQAQRAADLTDTLKNMTDRDGADAAKAALDVIAATSTTLGSDAAAALTAWQTVFAAVTNPADCRLMCTTQAALWAADDTGLDQLLYVLALGAAVNATSTEVFKTYDAAVAARDEITTQMDTLAETIVDADLFAALYDAKAALVEAVNDGLIQLPKIKTITQPVSVPALVLAQRLYGDPSRATQIVELNGASDPSCVAGELQVLSE